jgi:SpoVK/Ycf46/Vps4 family AAA+-type ATPase
MRPVWEWQKNYRVWEANRQMFLYPENWTEPELRPVLRMQSQLSEVTRVARAQRTSVLLTSAKRPETLLAGRALAAGLGRELYRVDLTRVVSKYIGETEKNIDRVFAEAEAARPVLLFDEADALFGQRTGVKDSHDRFANAEVGYLLQRMETYDGVAMLATNADRNSVATFATRFSSVLDLAS